MIEDFLCAFKGKVQWDCLCRKIIAERYLFMPHESEEYNEYALQYLTKYMKNEKIHSVCIITCDKSMYEREISKTYPKEYKIYMILKTEKWIHNILKFYALYEFSSKIKIISLTKPYNTGGENLLGVHGTTKKELFCYDIFGFAQIPDKGEDAL